MNIETQDSMVTFSSAEQTVRGSGFTNITPAKIDQNLDHSKACCYSGEPTEGAHTL